MIEVKCSECGKTKKVFLSRFKKYKEHFCNRECYKKYHSKTEFITPFIPCTTYIDGSGRARVHYPSHKRSDKYGYVMRSIVHWEWFNNISIPTGYDIHHKNKNRLDDTKENLEIIEHIKHSHLHHPKVRQKLVCSICGNKFERTQHRIRYKRHFCSRECFNKRGKNGIRRKS